MANNFWNGPRRTFVDGSLPYADADTLNGAQQDGNDAGGIFVHGALWMYEDFLGAAPGGANILSKDFINGGSHIWQYVDDSANGAYGAVKAIAQTGAANAFMQTNSGMAISSSEDFSFSARVRYTSFAGTPDALVGVADGNWLLGSAAGVAAVVYYPAANGNGHWWLWYGNSGKITGSPYPTMVDLIDSPGATYQNIDIVRTGGVIQAFINGVQRASVSPTPYAMASASAFVEHDYAISGQTIGFCDYVKFWSRTTR